jgi:branched-chain amino acid transport system ATP-binding protein
MTVDENLDMGAYLRSEHREIEEDRERVFSMFPRLAERRKQIAGTLSGGEQQMLAIGRAIMSKPKLMMLDEPSLGLSPRLADQVLAHIRDLNRQHGLTILLVEQNTQRALEIAHRAYLLELGQVLREGPAAELAADHTLLDAYLGRGQTPQRPTPAQLTT